MKIKQLLRDYEVPFAESGKNIQQGWIGLNCPFCDDPSMHLGYDLDEEYGQGFNCWRCGPHRGAETISRLIGVSKKEAREIIRQYDGKEEAEDISKKVSVRKKGHKLPSNITELQSIHRNYLHKRGFDPDYIEKHWGVMATGPTSVLDGVNFRLRLIIPIFWDGKRVSWQSRDVTGKNEPKYINCPKDRELINNKTIVYGKQDEWRDTIIVTEGITDVWRLGPMSIATLGISFKEEQVKLIARNFKRVAVMFDSEPQAQKQANQLISMLEYKGVDAWNVTVDTDPADLNQKEANELVEQIKNHRL